MGGLWDGNPRAGLWGGAGALQNKPWVLLSHGGLLEVIKNKVLIGFTEIVIRFVYGLNMVLIWF